MKISKLGWVFFCFFCTLYEPEEDVNEYARILDRDTIEDIQKVGLKYYKRERISTVCFKTWFRFLMVKNEQCSIRIQRVMNKTTKTTQLTNQYEYTTRCPSEVMPPQSNIRSQS